MMGIQNNKICIEIYIDWQLYFDDSEYYSPCSVKFVCPKLHSAKQKCKSNVQS